MALPILQNIATVFGAAVPAYQEARKFVLESQQAALDYRIAVAELLIRARTQELANAARMRTAAADAIDTVRETYAIGSPEYITAMTELRQANVPQEQIDDIVGAFAAQGFMTEDQRGAIFDLTKGDRPDDGGGSGRGGLGEGMLDPEIFQYESTLVNSRIDRNLRDIEALRATRRDDSKWDAMSDFERTGLEETIKALEDENNRLESDQQAALNSRNYLYSHPYATIEEIRRLYPQSWLSEGVSAGADITPAPTVSTPTPTRTPVVTPSSYWGLQSPPTYGPVNNPGMSPADSARVNQGIELDRISPEEFR